MSSILIRQLPET